MNRTNDQTHSKRTTDQTYSKTQIPDKLIQKHRLQTNSFKNTDSRQTHSKTRTPGLTLWHPQSKLCCIWLSPWRGTSHLCTSVYTHTHKHTHEHTHIHAHTHACTPPPTHTWARTHTHTHTHTHIHTQACTPPHTHTHTHMSAPPPTHTLMNTQIQHTHTCATHTHNNNKAKLNTNLLGMLPALHGLSHHVGHPQPGLLVVGKAEVPVFLVGPGDKMALLITCRNLFWRSGDWESANASHSLYLQCFGVCMCVVVCVLTWGWGGGMCANIHILLITCRLWGQTLSAAVPFSKEWRLGIS